MNGLWFWEELHQDWLIKIVLGEWLRYNGIELPKTWSGEWYWEGPGCSFRRVR